MTAPRAALVAFLTTMAIVHAVIGWWTPVQGEDWAHWVWAAQHKNASGLTWLLDFAGSHFTFGDATGYALARLPLVHIIVSPLVMVAFVVGVFVLAFRRLPRATWDDTIGVALVSACVWFAQPRAGLTLFHTSNVALNLYGVTLAVWFVAPLRCGWSVPRAVWPLMALAGYAVGTSTRVVATATVVGMVVALRTRASVERTRWMWVAFAGLVVGVVVGYLDPPWLEMPKVFRRGLEPNLILFKVPLEEAGELVALVLGLVLVNAILGALGRPHVAAETAPDARETRRWLLAWLVTAMWSLFGPHYGEATLLAATALVTIAVLPYLCWLAQTRVLRYVLIAIVIGTHVVVWVIGLATYHQLGLEGQARLAALEATPHGQTAVVPPYSRVVPSFWFLGEDMARASARQQVAVGAFGLRDIDLSPTYRRYELNPQVAVELEVEGVTAAELETARAPEIWAGELSVVRKQFAQLVARLRRIKPSFTAQLRVTNVDFDERGSRPLLAAWFDGRELVAPRISRGATEQNSRYTIRIYPPFAARFTEAWSIVQGEGHKRTLRGGTMRIQPMQMGLHAAVACDANRCLVAEVFIPWF